MSTICSPFSSQLIASNFSSMPIVFRQFFPWTALRDKGLCFSLILARKANGVETETKRAA
jgi:hypothetical protein